MSQIWKSHDGKLRLETWYERFLQKIDREVTSTQVPTRFGESHVLVTGPASAPPLVCLHAMRTGASFMLSEMGHALGHFRIYAPDLPGQSVRGLDRRLPLKDDSHANWLADVLEGLGLDKVNLFGVSWGGYVARNAASAMPERVARLGLMVPAGIANGSHVTGLVKMAWPMIRYRIKPSDANLRKLLEPILTTWDEDWAGFMATSLNDMKMDPRIPPLASDDALKKLTMPLLVLGGDQDISFPGEAIAKRLAQTTPHADVEVLKNCKHCTPCTPEFRTWLANRLVTFFS